MLNISGGKQQVEISYPIIQILIYSWFGVDE